MSKTEGADVYSMCKNKYFKLEFLFFSFILFEDYFKYNKTLKIFVVQN